MIGRLCILALLVAAPLAAQQTGSAAEIVKQMTPEERAMAQRKLNAAAAVFYNTQLDSTKKSLRAVLTVMRDSMLAGSNSDTEVSGRYGGNGPFRFF